MQTDLYLVRHGETASNRARRIQGWNNEPLNELGRWQAERAGAHLAHFGLQALYASPLDRARETATIIGQVVGLKPTLVDGLREMNTGVASGLHSAQFMLRHPRLLWAWLRDDPTLAFPEGDTLTAFYLRAWQTIDGLVARHQGQAIAIVAHGGSISGYLSILLQGRGSNRIALKLRNGAICHVRWLGDATPQLLALNQAAHLNRT